MAFHRSILAQAAIMADELEGQRLRVVLVEAKDKPNPDAKVRQVQEENPDWYRGFCSTYRSSRISKNHLFKTAIKRRETLRALQNIAAGQTKSVPNQNSQDGGYIKMLIPVIEQELDKRRALDKQIEQDEKAPF